MITRNIDERLTVTQAAQRAAVTPETVRRWIHDERLPATRTTTGTYRIDPRELARLLNVEPQQTAGAQ